MAEIKVSQLTEASVINDEDLLMIVQNGENKKITKANAKFASGDEVYIGDTEPTGEDDDSVKIWVEPSEDSVESEGTYISNSYGVSTEIGYSENYINNCNTYSTDEIDTGKTWIDGKPIYRKVIDCGTITGGKNVAHNISGINRVIDIKGTAYRSNVNCWIPIPYVNTEDAYQIQVQITSTNVHFDKGASLQDTISNCIVVIEYTKTS